jgi:hypothetical protein
MGEDIGRAAAVGAMHDGNRRVGKGHRGVASNGWVLPAGDFPPSIATTTPRERQARLVPGDEGRAYAFVPRRFAGAPV